MVSLHAGEERSGVVSLGRQPARPKPGIERTGSYTRFRAGQELDSEYTRFRAGQELNSEYTRFRAGQELMGSRMCYATRRLPATHLILRG